MLEACARQGYQEPSTFAPLYWYFKFKDNDKIQGLW